MQIFRQRPTLIFGEIPMQFFQANFRQIGLFFLNTAHTTQQLGPQL
jgi:hypothetical protein